MLIISLFSKNLSLSMFLSLILIKTECTKAWKSNLPDLYQDDNISCYDYILGVYIRFLIIITNAFPSVELTKTCFIVTLLTYELREENQ